MRETGAYWIELKDGGFITAHWDDAAQRWSFEESGSQLTQEEFATLGHTIHVRREGDETVDDLLRRYRRSE